MAIQDLFINSAVWTRQSSVLYSGSMPVSASFSRTDTQPVLVRANGTDLSAGFSLTITGEFNGVSQSEVLAVPQTNPAIALGRKLFTKITDLTGSGPSGTIVINAVYSNGAEAFVNQVLNSTLPVRLSRLTRAMGDLSIEVQGAVPVELWAIYCGPVSVKAKDRMAIGAFTYEIQHVYAAQDHTAAHHIELVAAKL